MHPFHDRPLPEALQVLHELALDLRWSWNHYGDALWSRINPDVWNQTQNPVSVIQLTSSETLDKLAQQDDFVAQLADITAERKEHLTRQSWYQQHHSQSGLRGIAYFSMEFGLCEALPLYAGGLGVLAGDYLKTASDLGVPLVGIGLLYQEGYFHQSLSPDGHQQENYLYNDPAGLPIAPLLQPDGSWAHVSLELFARKIHFRVWCAQVGRVTLYLLDSNDPANQPHDRCITSKLYGGGTELRLLQEIALGIGGWRLIEQLGVAIDICHLNEGHAAFATLERIRSYQQNLRECEPKQDLDFWQALWATRIGNLFTTHTPVAAGFDCYPEELLGRYASHYAEMLGVPVQTLMQLGRANPEDANEGFNMAYLAMRTCGYSNGVSQLHGQVSQQIFQPLFPRWPQREVPVGYVTNGVHMPTWDSPAADELWTKAYGRQRWRGALELFNPERDVFSNEDLAILANKSRAQLVEYVRRRLGSQGEDANRLDPDRFTLGFARRFAEYKRPDLLLADEERLVRLLNNPERPVQLIIAGKAHPADEQGKRALERWQAFLRRPEVRQHAVFIKDYDLALAQQLVQGVDLWINTPRRPWEACGTSGMKVLVNGGLNLSTLDGWWAEAYQPDVGWALGMAEQAQFADHLPLSEQDARDALQLYQLLEEKVIPRFYQRDPSGQAHEWLSIIRNSMTRLTPRFSSNRMLRDYLQQYYLPAAVGIANRQANNNEQAKQLRQWQQQWQTQWAQLQINKVEINQRGQQLQVRAEIYLAELEPGAVNVQLIADPMAAAPAQLINLQLQASNGQNHQFAADINTSRPAEDFTLRLIPAHANILIPQEVSFIKWQR